MIFNDVLWKISGRSLINFKYLSVGLSVSKLICSDCFLMNMASEIALPMIRPVVDLEYKACRSLWLIDHTSDSSKACVLITVDD